MVVVKQLAAEFQIQLVAEMGDALPDVGRLHFQIFVVVKTDFSCTHDGQHPFCSGAYAGLMLGTLSLTLLLYTKIRQIAREFHGFFSGCTACPKKPRRFLTNPGEYAIIKSLHMENVCVSCILCDPFRRIFHFSGGSAHGQAGRSAGTAEFRNLFNISLLYRNLHHYDWVFARNFVLRSIISGFGGKSGSIFPTYRAQDAAYRKLQHEISADRPSGSVCVFYYQNGRLL